MKFAVSVTFIAVMVILSYVAILNHQEAWRSLESMGIPVSKQEKIGDLIGFFLTSCLVAGGAASGVWALARPGSSARAWWVRKCMRKEVPQDILEYALLVGLIVLVVVGAITTAGGKLW